MCASVRVLLGCLAESLGYRHCHSSWCQHLLAPSSCPPPARLPLLQVRTVALAALLGVIPHLSPEVRRARVMPVLRQHMQPLELDPSMQRCVAAHFPELLAAMQPDMAPDDVGRVYGCFRRLAARQDTELRRWAGAAEVASYDQLRRRLCGSVVHAC